MKSAFQESTLCTCFDSLNTVDKHWLQISLLIFAPLFFLDLLRYKDLMINIAILIIHKNILNKIHGIEL